MRAEYLTRQSDLINSNMLVLPITVVGAGAVGSFTVLTLAKMGFTDITVWDDDEIDPENMNCQFYRVGDIKKKKVVALQELVKDFTEVEIKIVDGRFDRSKEIGTIVLSAVDSMEARKEIYEAISECLTEVFYVDSRMAAEKIAIYAGSNHDAKFLESYEQSLYTDDEAVQERCTAKSTMYTVNLIAGLVGKAVKDFISADKHVASLSWDVSTNGAVWFNAEGIKLTM